MTDAQATIPVLAGRVRDRLSGWGRIEEQRMFGGIGFLLDGHLLCHVSRKGLMMRIRRERESNALTSPHATPCLHGTRATPGFVQVEPAGVEAEADLSAWLTLGCDYLATLENRPAGKDRP